MKILVIANLYPSPKDPTYGTFVKVFVEEIQKRNSDGELDLCVIRGRTNNILLKIYKYALFYIKIFYYILFKKYDVIYNHIITHAAIPLRILSVFKSLPLIFNIHGEDLLTKTKISAIFLKIAKPMLYSSKLIVVPSIFFKAKLQEKMPDLPENKIFVSASGGIEKDFFTSPMYGEHSSLTLGYVSRIDRGKGWNLFIDAVYQLNSEGEDVIGVMAGTGFQLNLLRDKIKESTKIKYVGAVPHSKLPQFYSQLDLFVFPTILEESLGLVGLEAMANHVPVIGSNIGGLTDYIENCKNGFLFTPNDREDLVAKIKEYLRMSQKGKNIMRDNAYHTALSYETNLISDKLFNKIKEVL